MALLSHSLQKAVGEAPVHAALGESKDVAHVTGRRMRVRSKSNRSSVAAARDDMDESDLMVVSFIENPVVFEGKAGEVGRIIMICFADTGEARDQSANCHEVGDEFIACIFTKLFVDVGCNIISLAAEGRCKDNASHASMERAPLRRFAIRRFISSK